MAVAVTDNATVTLNESLLEQSFWQSPTDGFWYPVRRGDARARIKIEGGLYSIQTRRRPDAPWTLLVKALVSDFDPDTFRTWCREWPLEFT